MRPHDTLYFLKKILEWEIEYLQSNANIAWESWERHKRWTRYLNRAKKLQHEVETLVKVYDKIIDLENEEWVV